MQPAVFLDRDNTLIVNDGDLGDPDAVRVIPGVPGALRRLRDSGYRLIVVTNQAGVARGRFSEADVDRVHERLARLVDEAGGGRGLIDRFYYCPFHPEATLESYRGDHPWRKPRPGMLLQAAADLELDIASSWMIGDQPRDVEAGQAAGCRTILLANGGPPLMASPTATVPSISEAVDVVLAPPTDRPRPPTPNPSRPQPGEGDRTGLEQLQRSVAELAEELRTDRLRRAEFTMLRMLATVCQLLVLLLALLGLLQLGTLEIFGKWMAAAVLVQLFTIALILLDGRE